MMIATGQRSAVPSAGQPGAAPTRRQEMAQPSAPVKPAVDAVELSWTAKIMLRELKLHCYGLRNAKPRDFVLGRVQVGTGRGPGTADVLADREMRRAFAELREKVRYIRQIVGSSPDEGYWYCTNQAEVDYAAACLRAPAKKMMNQADDLVEVGLEIFGSQLSLLNPEGGTNGRGNIGSS